MASRLSACRHKRCLAETRSDLAKRSQDPLHYQ